MSAIPSILIPLALGVTVLILFAGLYNMMRGGSSSLSQNLMRARVVAQFVAVVLIVAALYFFGPK